MADSLSNTTLSNLESDATQVRNEQTPKANTAVRVGSLLLAIIAAMRTLRDSVGGFVKSIDGKVPDTNGNVSLSFVKTVNGRAPDNNGEVSLDNARYVTQAGTVLNMAYGSQSAGSITNLVINELREVSLLAEVTLKLISENNQAYALPGTASAAASGIITGVGTDFLTSLSVGTRLRLGGLYTYVVGSISSNTQLRIVGAPTVQTGVSVDRITPDAIGGLLTWDSARQGKMSLTLNGVAATPATINQVGGNFLPGRPHRVSVRCTQMPQLNTSLGYEFDVFIAPLPQ